MDADIINSDEKKIIRQLAIVGVCGNVLLTAFKLYAGIVGKSSAMITDAIHSLTDVFATAVAYAGALLGRKPADYHHQYGHERIETLASIILGCILFVTGGGIAVDAIESIVCCEYLYKDSPEMIAIVAAIVSIVVKEAMFWFTMYYAKKLGSSAFKADAWHHRSDALSSVGALIGIVGAMNGIKILEEIACIFIAILIIKVAFDVLRDGVSKLLDTSCGKQYEDGVRNLILSQDGVQGIDELKTRKFGDKKLIDAEICVDGKLSLNDAHAIAEDVHVAAEQRYADVKHIMIHVNPC